MFAFIHILKTIYQGKKQQNKVPHFIGFAVKIKLLFYELLPQKTQNHENKYNKIMGYHFLNNTLNKTIVFLYQILCSSYIPHAVSMRAITIYLSPTPYTITYDLLWENMCLS